MNKLRISHLVVQPVLVLDDGEELTSGPQLEAAPVSISQIEDYVARLREFVSQQNATSGLNM